MQQPKVDFYILNEKHARDAHLFACQLIEKIYLANQQQVYIQVDTSDEAERFDTLLWTFRDNSFVPHNLNTHKHKPAPIQIGFADEPLKHHDVLVNFSREIPEFYNQFKQVIEIVFADASVQQLARDRYKKYRDQGCEINTHKTNASGYKNNDSNR